MTIEQAFEADGWVNAVLGDNEFGRMRYKLTFTESGDYQRIFWQVVIRGEYCEGVATYGDVAPLGNSWPRAMEIYLRKQYGLPPPDFRSSEQKELDGLRASWERVGVLALGLDEWAEIFNSRALTDIASELLVLAQSKMIAAAREGEGTRP